MWLQLNLDSRTEAQNLWWWWFLLEWCKTESWGADGHVGGLKPFSQLQLLVSFSGCTRWGFFFFFWAWKGRWPPYRLWSSSAFLKLLNVLECIYKSGTLRWGSCGWGQVPIQDTAETRSVAFDPQKLRFGSIDFVVGKAIWAQIGRTMEDPREKLRDWKKGRKEEL